MPSNTTDVVSVINWDTLLPMVVTVSIAIAGYLFTYFHKKKVDERSNRLQKTNLQLRELYGPLYAELLAGEVEWDAFLKCYWPSHGEKLYFDEKSKLTEQELKRWRIWREEVFHPKNMRIEKIIKENIDLYDGKDFPIAFVHLMAHVAGYKAIIRQWEEGDFTEHISVCNFPYSGLMEIVEPEYKRLKILQHELIEVSE